MGVQLRENCLSSPDISMFKCVILPILVMSSVDILIKGHRGSRGEAIENTLPAFAW